MPAGFDQELSALLESAITHIDIPDDQFELATKRYRAVGTSLEESASNRGVASENYVQGSFMLGTVTRPVGDRAQYDIDMVDELKLAASRIRPTQLKEQVGDDLREFARSRPEGQPGLKEKNRCWTLDYSQEPFHIDVLPAIPNPGSSAPGAILITDRQLRAWQHSNPRDFGKWFRARMAAEFERRHQVLAGVRALDEVPEYKVKTTLQRAVQFLKRHRDLHFAGRPHLATASIIVTTLAAKAYTGEDHLFRVLTQIVRNMALSIERRGGEYWVPNPVQQLENFADRWNKEPELVKAFFAWMDSAQAALNDLETAGGINGKLVVLSKALGPDAAKASGLKLGSQIKSLSSAGAIGIQSGTGILQPTNTRPAPKHNFHGGHLPARLP